MKKHLRLFISSALIVLTFVSPQVIHGMEDLSMLEAKKASSGIQLSEGAHNTLESVIGTGKNVLLKMSMSLDTLKQPLEKGQLEVPVRLFLTDFASSPTKHPAIGFKVKIDYEPAPLVCILPDKPKSFDSYAQFTGWLNKGYFSNQIRIIYDFHVDINKSAPSLAKHLFSVLPGGYQFIGTHAVNNDVIKPDQCVPKVTYSSTRGKTNTTVATLGGALHLNDFQYPIENCYQVFPHAVVGKSVVKREGKKKFYSHKHLKSDVITKVTYKEFLSNQTKNWPNAPAGTYNLLEQNDGYLEKIEHLGCWDGNSGEEVDISDGRIFLIVSEDINKPLKDGSQLMESIVEDKDRNLYTTRYHYSFPFSLVMRVPEVIKFNILRHLTKGR